MGNTVDASILEPYSAALMSAVEKAAPGWIRRRLSEIAGATPVEIDTVAARVVEEMIDGLFALLQKDVDEQRDNPLHVLRRATGSASSALLAAGVAVPPRDEFEVRAMPDDIYAIGPLTWRDLSDDVHDAGITWGAWKAATVLSRRRSEGKLT
jgi:hypothetical protein